jgi:hypothetical protein
MGRALVVVKGKLLTCITEIYNVIKKTSNVTLKPIKPTIPRQSPIQSINQARPCNQMPCSGWCDCR